MGAGAASDTAPVAAAAAAQQQQQQHGGGDGATDAAAAAASAAAAPRVKLVGYDNFKRHNPRSDRFGVHRFHHVEFWCADATNTYKR